jgi:signal transduction histidine kinase
VLKDLLMPGALNRGAKPAQRRVGGHAIAQLQRVPGSFTGLVIALVLLAFVATLSFLGWQQYSNSAAEARVTNRQIIVLNRIMRSLEKAQSAERGFLLSAKAADARPESGKQPASSSRGAIDSAAVLRGVLNNPKAADARPESGKQPAHSSRGPVDTAAVLRGVFNTRESAYVERYRAAETNVRQLFPSLSQSFPIGDDLVPRFRKSASAILPRLDETMQLAKAGPLDQALTISRLDEEAEMMDRARALADDTEQALDARLTNLRSDTRFSARWAQLIATIGCTGVFAILLFSYVRIKRLLSTRALLNDRLATTNEDLQQFIFSASHDLQEPLRTLRIFADSLENKIKAHRPFERDLFHLRTAAGQMSALLADLLIYTEVAAEPLKIGEGAQMEKIVQEIVQELNEAVTTHRARVHFGELGLIPMASDHARHLLRNLISNAIRFRDPNIAPEVHVSASHDDHRWLVCVKDNGIGIQPEYHQHIFGIFKRLHTRSTYPGTGLGLAICKKIVERYGGRIWVESAPAAGSSFFFSIPDVGSPKRLSA